MKILFIWFNFCCHSVGMNIGVSILSRELQQAGHDVRILHLNEILGYDFDVNKIVRDAENFDPDIFALSFGSNHYLYAMQLSKALKKEFPEKLLMCGGIHTTLNPESVMKENAIDIIALGEVDGGHLVQFLEALKYKDDFRNFSNFWIREGNRIHRNPVQYLPDISQQSFLNYSLIDYHSLTKARKGFMEISSSRGCPYQCAYCQNHAFASLYQDSKLRSRYLRQRSVENLILELHIAREQVGSPLKVFLFADDTFIMKKEWIHQFSERYLREINIPFSCCGLVRLIDEDIALDLAESNCMIVRIGIETANEKTRAFVLGKRLKNSDFERAIGIMKRFDINIGGYVMIGIPHETEKDILNTFRYFAQLRIDVIRCTICYPFENTRMYDYCKEKSLLQDSVDFTSYFFDSRLKWNPHMRLFLKKSIAIFPLILNMYLEHRESDKCESIVTSVLKMDEVTWENPQTKEWLRESLQNISLTLLEKGLEHYVTPFSDRPDTAFLIRKRKNKLVNLDEMCRRLVART